MILNYSLIIAKLQVPSWDSKNFNRNSSIPKSVHMKFHLSSILILFSLVFSIASCDDKRSKEEIIPSRPRPNIVIIFLDDAGYSDFKPFGEGEVPTPHVEQLAEEGTMFTNFHVPQAICSASRSALLTGCYPGRTKVFGAHGPKERGLETTFPTLGEVFKKGHGVLMSRVD
jgi:hypothetical protein